MVRYGYKLILLGADGAGKRSLIQRYTNPDAPELVPHEGGIYYGARIWSLPDGDPDDDFYLSLLSPEIGDALAARWHEFWKGGNGIIACYDTGDSESFEALEDWLDIAKQYEYVRSLPRLLVGTKHDLLTAGRTSTVTDVETLAAKCGCFARLECSAKTGYNVDRVFQTMLIHIFERKHTEEGNRLQALWGKK